VRALEAMRAERARRRAPIGRATFDVEEAQASGKLVAEAEHVDFAWPGKTVVRDFSTRIQRGDRVALLGPNGAGKTTLLRLLLGELAPDAGRVRLGTKLEIAYFDQLRMRLDPEATVLASVAEGREFFELGGARRHVVGYLQDFLFPPDRARAQVRTLSGGERNRLLLARLFSQPTNLLVLDEPTNDLDIETLELLEERLLEFDGTILLVSHDRAFVDHVATQTLAFEGDGRVFEYVGGHTDWLRQRRTPAAAVSAAPSPRRARPTQLAAAPKKLGFHEQRELAELPAKIEALEALQAELAAEVSRPEFYKRAPDEQARVRVRLAELPAELEAAYARWEALEARPRS
jgi:ATP-binding cassette subfamily F protein uup